MSEKRKTKQQQQLNSLLALLKQKVKVQSHVDGGKGGGVFTFD